MFRKQSQDSTESPLIEQTQRLSASLLVVVLLTTCLLVLLVACSEDSASSPPASFEQGDTSSTGNSDETIAHLYRDKQSDVQVEGSGTVVRILSDDTEGSQHQKFILELASGQTILIAHNIDLAPRLDGLAEGDTVEFNGVYEYSDEGGTVHWTHKDPDGSHVDGWLSWNGQLYQ